MSTLERSVDIAAPVASVWAVLENVSLLPEFSPSTTAVGGTDCLKSVGDEFSQTVRVAGREFTSTWTVVDIEQRARLVIEGSVLPGTHYRMTESLVAKGDLTTMTLRMDYRLPFGVVGRLVARLGAERRAGDEAATVLVGVKKQAEADVAASR